MLLASITNNGRTITVQLPFTTSGVYIYAFVYLFVSGTVNASGDWTLLSSFKVCSILTTTLWFPRDVSVQSKSRVYVCSKRKLQYNTLLYDLILIAAPGPSLGVQTYANVSAGSSVLFNCTLSLGTPATSIEWFWNAQYVANASASVSSNYVVRNTSASALAVSSVGAADAGVFECVAENAAGFAVQTFRQLVTTQAPVLLGGLANAVANVGYTVFFTCSFSGLPPPAVTWLLDAANGNGNGNVNVSNSSRASVSSASTGAAFYANTLTITSVQLADAGLYTCLIRNALGNVSSSATLTVGGGNATTAATTAAPFYQEAWFLALMVGVGLLLLFVVLGTLLLVALCVASAKRKRKRRELEDFGVVPANFDFHYDAELRGSHSSRRSHASQRAVGYENGHQRSLSNRSDRRSNRFARGDEDQQESGEHVRPVDVPFAFERSAAYRDSYRRRRHYGERRDSIDSGSVSLDEIASGPMRLYGSGSRRSRSSGRQQRHIRSSGRRAHFAPSMAADSDSASEQRSLSSFPRPSGAAAVRSRLNGGGPRGFVAIPPPDFFSAPSPAPVKDYSSSSNNTPRGSMRGTRPRPLPSSWPTRASRFPTAPRAHRSDVRPAAPEEWRTAASCAMPMRWTATTSICTKRTSPTATSSTNSTEWTRSTSTRSLRQAPSCRPLTGRPFSTRTRTPASCSMPTHMQWLCEPIRPHRRAVSVLHHLRCFHVARISISISISIRLPLATAVCQSNTLI